MGSFKEVDMFSEGLNNTERFVLLMVVLGFCIGLLCQCSSIEQNHYYLCGEWTMVDQDDYSVNFYESGEYCVFDGSDHYTGDWWIINDTLMTVYDGEYRDCTYKHMGDTLIFCHYQCNTFVR
jgi:hypothetical protein